MIYDVFCLFNIINKLKNENNDKNKDLKLGMRFNSGGFFLLEIPVELVVVGPDWLICGEGDTTEVTILTDIEVFIQIVCLCIYSFYIFLYSSKKEKKKKKKGERENKTFHRFIFIKLCSN